MRIKGANKVFSIMDIPVLLSFFFLLSGYQVDLKYRKMDGTDK
jgi:hypothetical protein